MAENVLEVKDLHFRYGEIKALRGISFNVREGEIVTLLGGNGAGKTTTLQSISGLISGTSSGEIRFMGKDITGRSPHSLAKMGIAQCLEGRLIFSQLTVLENLQMGAYLRKGERVQRDLDYVFSLFPRLLERKGQLGGTLSGGEQQMLAVGRAIMSDPQLLMLDEPSMGLAPLVVAEIFNVIKKVHDMGITVLLVEQNAKMALKISDKAYLLNTGTIVASGTGDEFLKSDVLTSVYLGGKKE